MATSAATPSKNVTHEAIVRDVRAGKFSPVYYLMGEESYYIDRIADFIVQEALSPEETDLNLVTLYGGEVKMSEVLDQARAFPMLGERLVVRVNEAQRLDGLELLEAYLKFPQPSTVLIFCHKDGVLDRRKRLASLIDKTGVLFESKPLKDAQLVTFVNDYMHRKRVGIEADAVAMMVESVGADLNRMAGELEKLCLALGEGGGMVTAALVERNIGLSREFTIFELQDALGMKDAQRVTKIANYFEKNAKAYPLQRILPSLFRYYSNLMLAYYAPEKTERGIAAWLGLTDWQVRKNVLPAMKVYRGMKVMQILSEIRRADALSKGVGGASGASQGDILKQLLFFILH